MIKEQDFRDNLTPEELRKHFEQFGLDATTLIGLSPQEILVSCGQKIGMRPKYMTSYPEYVREFIRAIKSNEPMFLSLKTSILALEEFISAFESLLNKEAIAQLETGLKLETIAEFRTRLHNICFMRFLYRSPELVGTENMLTPIVTWMLDQCSRSKDKNFIWRYTWEELEHVVSLVMVQEGGKKQHSFMITNSMKKQLMEEHAAWDPLFHYLLPLSTFSEDQMRKVIHKLFHKFINAVNKWLNPGFEKPRAYYLRNNRGNWKPVWSNTYAVMAPYFGWPADLEAYAQELNPAATTSDFDDYSKKKIQRLFANSRRKSGQKI